jgi:hypothetical protein
MFKNIWMKILLGIVILLAVVVVGRNVIIKGAVSTGVKAVTGLDLKIDKMNIGLANTLLGINGLVLYNPDGFVDEVMMDLPEIYVDYDLGAIMKKKVHLKEVRLNLKEFTIVKNKDGVLNLDSLTAVKSAKKEAPKEEKKEEKPKQDMELKIDLLKLKLGKVVYKDYSNDPEKPSTQEFVMNIDEEFQDITDPKSVVTIIVMKAMANNALANLTNFKLGPLADSLQGSVKGAGKLVTDIAGDTLGIGKDVGGKAVETTTEAVKKTTETLKNLLPFGGKK